MKWTSTATSRLLLEAGLGTYLSNWNTRERYAEDQPLSLDARRAMVQVNEQCAATQPFDAFGRGGTCAQNGGIAGLNYRNQSFWNADWIGAHTWNSAATFVTGSTASRSATRAPITPTTARRKAAPTTSPTASTTAFRTS